MRPRAAWRAAGLVLLASHLLLTQLVVGCATKPRTEVAKTERRVPLLFNEPWLVGKSENFEIFSALSEDETRSLLRELELFRALVFATTNAPRRVSPVPTWIFAFDSDRDYRIFSESEDTKGQFRPGLRFNEILISDGTKRMTAESVIKHEYVHFVVDNGSEVTYPLWYDEGFAEFLSSATLDGDYIVIGGVPPARVPALRSSAWLSLREIIEATGYESIEGPQDFMLYPQAWALVHHLTLGRQPAKGVMAWQLNRFMLLRKRGIEAVPAFEAAFEVSLPDLDRRILRNLREGMIQIGGFPVGNLDYDQAPARMRQASKAEAATRLGTLALARGQVGTAGRYFEKALVLDPSSAVAQSGLGDSHKFAGRDAEAEPYFRSAAAQAPEDLWIQLDLGEFLDERAGRAATRVASRRDRGEARQVFASVLARDASMPETHAVLGTSYLHGADEGGDEADLEIALRHLEAARRLLPSSLELIHRLAAVHLARGERDRARELLSTAMAARLSKENAGSIDSTLAAMDAQRNARIDRWRALPETEPPPPPISEDPARESDAPG